MWVEHVVMLDEGDIDGEKGLFHHGPSPKSAKAVLEKGVEMLTVLVEWKSV